MRISAAIAALLASGCASTQLAPVSSGVQLEHDERTLWHQAEQAETRFEAGGAIYADAEVEAYLDQVARRIEPPSVFATIPFRIRVVRNPYLNAFTLPNGVIYVHTGILARMENEAQLATLLGHEMTHATHRHAIQAVRSANAKGVALG